MASLKEIKGRIASIQSTQKITAAMRMVASAKLRKTQTATENFLRYKEELRKIIAPLYPPQVGELEKLPSTELERLPVPDSKVTSFPLPTGEGVRGRGFLLLPISSNSGLCGAFNSNIAKATFKRIAELKAQGATVQLMPVGKKIAHELRKGGFDFIADHTLLTERMEHGDGYAEAGNLLRTIKSLCADNTALQVEFIYHHFKSMGSQIITLKPFDVALHLPIEQEPSQAQYLTEPSPAELLSSLHPQLLQAEFYGTLLDSLTSEHAARMLAMQTADDNANDLLKELTLTYNKTRQQAITNELIDIMGGKTAS